MLRLTILGYKFEKLAVLPKTWHESTREEIEGRGDEVVNNAAQYCSVVRTGIGNVRMILGGEVDASMFTLILVAISNPNFFYSLGQQAVPKRKPH
jgi:hypothetical protein